MSISFFFFFLLATLYSMQDLSSPTRDQTYVPCSGRAESHPLVHQGMHDKSLQLCLTLRPYGLQPARLLCPCDSPGKNTGLDCHAILHRIEPMSFTSPALAGRYFTTSATWEAQGWSLMSVFFSFNHYAMATQGLNTRRHWVKGVPGPCAIFSVNRILKSPFLVNR